MESLSDSFARWAILTGSVGHRDLYQCAQTIADVLGDPVRLNWPAPFGLPETADSPGFDDSDPLHPPRQWRIPSAIFPDASPELFVARSSRNPAPEVPEDILLALGERWRKTLAESTQAIDQAWNHLWLAIHTGLHGPADLFPLLTAGAEVIVRAPVNLLAIRQPGQKVLELVHARGLRSPGSWTFRLPISRGIGGFVVETQESVVVTDYRESHWRDPLMEPLAEKEQLISGIAVPWQALDGMDGVLYVWFRTPGQPSPLALMALQRYVRSIRAVVLSAQSASPYPYSVALSQLANDPAGLRVLRLLRLARRQTAWEPLLAALTEEHIGIQVNDAWGQTLQQSSDIPSTPPDRSVPLDGLETGLVSLWGGRSELIDVIYPHLVQTVLLLLNADARRSDERARQAEEWLRRIRGSPEDREEAWDKRVEYTLPPNVVQIWCARVSPGGMLPASGKALLRAIKNHCRTQPIPDGRDILLFLPNPLSVQGIDELRHHISRRLVQPVFWAGMHATLDAATINAAITRLKDTLASLERSHPQGVVRFLNRPSVDNLLAVPALDTPLNLFMESWIGPLGRYDIQHGTDLVTTLEIYLASGSLSRTARALFVHPNTVRYRLEQVEELLPGMDVFDHDVRVALLLAARAWQLKHNPSTKRQPPKKMSPLS